MGRAWTHWATSLDLVALRLPAHDAGTGLDGRSLGTAQRGGAFVFDPFDAYAADLVSNPNVIVAGSIGAGKSTVVKMIVDRALERGRSAVVIDPKGEYAQLSAHYKVDPIALGRDGWCDPFPSEDVGARELLRALIASAQGAPLDPEQRFVLDEEWRAMPTPRPSRVLGALYERLAPHIQTAQSSAKRSLALVLYRFIHGDLSGLFDGAGEPMSFEGRLVVLDLSAQWSSDSFAVAVLCCVAAAQRVVARSSTKGYLILDEAWALLSNQHALQWLQGSWKLARSRGLCHFLVLHRWTDVSAVGDEGTAQRERARGLLRECETAWLFRQPPDEAREMALALGLHANEERYLTAVPKGTALVRYGAHSSVVRVEPDRRDRAFVDTDSAMRDSSA